MSTYQDSYNFILLALCIWREARGELYITKQAVGYSIRNRVLNPGWWGKDWGTVVLQPYQYSSFNANDPNSHKMPYPDDQAWGDSLKVADEVMNNPQADLTHGAVNYFDCSLDTNPPRWAIDGSHVKTVDYGRLHFYRRA